MNIDEEIKSLFDAKGKEEVRDYLLVWNAYCDCIDDEVDEEKDKTRVRRLTTLASQHYNHPYWQKNWNLLLPAERLIHNEYFDSTIWEQSIQEWKRIRSKVYSNAGLNMLLLIILKEFGQSKMDEMSIKIREYAYEKHKGDVI